MKTDTQGDCPDNIRHRDWRDAAVNQARPIEGCRQKLRRDKDAPYPFSEECDFDDTLILDIELTELWDSKFLLFFKHLSL